MWISTNPSVWLQHFRDSPAVLLKSAPPAVLPSGVIDTTRQFFVLAFVPPEVRSGARGMFGPYDLVYRGVD